MTTTPTPTITGPLTLALTPARVVEDTDPLIVSGTSTSAAGTRVFVWSGASKDELTKAGKTVVNADQTWQLSLRPTEPGRLLMRATLRDGTQSALVRTEIIDRRNIVKAPEGDVLALEAAELNGRITHLDVGRARVQLLRYEGGAWVKVDATRTKANGHYTFNLPTDRDGITRFKTLARNGDFGPEASSKTQLRVKAALRMSSRGATREDVPSTWRPGCPVGPSELAVVKLVYRHFNGELAWGKIIVRRHAVPWVADVFGAALASGYRFTQISPADKFGGSDPAAMSADNTSAFNCRRVTGNPYALSPHSYGTAFDINPVRNPYQDVRGVWWPQHSAFYRDRSHHRAGMLYGDSIVVRRFRAHGLQWGGFWGNPDYQHFDP